MTQTLALFLDAYRDLNARKLFWITLILTAIFIGAFALLGFNSQGLTLAGHQFGLPFNSTGYIMIFSQVVIGFWLTWVATILALVSTAGIFPDLITGGSVELYLARPMSRLRLFITKYLCGLLFVLVQVLVVSIGGFLVMGWRGRVWMPSLLLAIPIVMLLFSYVYAVCVLLGVWTRSTIAALMLALLAWGLFFTVQQAEAGLLMWQRLTELRVEQAHRTIDASDVVLKESATHPTHDLLGLHAGIARKNKEIAVSSLPALEADTKLPHLLHQVAYTLRVLVPKTSETTRLLDRWLITDSEVEGNDELRRQRVEERHGEEGVDQFDASMDVQEIERHRSMGWIIGSSLIDEGVLLGLAAWIFCRRDY